MSNVSTVPVLSAAERTKIAYHVRSAREYSGNGNNKIPQRKFAKLVTEGNVPGWNFYSDAFRKLSFFSAYNIVRRHDKLIGNIAASRSAPAAKSAKAPVTSGGSFC